MHNRIFAFIFQVFINQNTIALLISVVFIFVDFVFRRIDNVRNIFMPSVVPKWAVCWLTKQWAHEVFLQVRIL